jgi:hypothetical protein
MTPVPVPVPVPLPGIRAGTGIGIKSRGGAGRNLRRSDQGQVAEGERLRHGNVTRGWRGSGMAVEVVAKDVVGDGGGEEIGTGVAGFETLAEIGGGDVLVDGLEEVDAGLLMGGEVEAGEVVEWEAGAADDDPFGEFEEAVGLAPVPEVEEGVGADEVEEGVGGHELMKGGEGLNGVVGSAVGVRFVEVGDAEAGIGAAGEGEHGEAVGEGGVRAVGLERLAGRRGEEDFVQREGVGGGGGDGEVAAVRWVEGSAEESYAHGLFSLEWLASVPVVL